MTNAHTRAFLEHAQVERPIICGAMYPTSNPELVAAVSEAGALGVIQPISLRFAHGYDIRDGLRYIRALTDKPVGMNLIVEKSVRAYERRMRAWLDIALEEGVRFFTTSLGNPRWVVERVHAEGGVVYHTVVERKWARKALDAGVDGLIGVNAEAGGHAGHQTPEALYADLADLGAPLVAAGGVGDPARFAEMLELGYGAVQMGTRFIATEECNAHSIYKDKILEAQPEDVALTDLLSGVPAAVIATPEMRRAGLRAGPITRRLLQHRRTKHWARTYLNLRSLWRLRRPMNTSMELYQAGKSVGGIDAVEPVAEIIERFSPSP